MTEINIYGIRHHGPGSARSLQAALRSFQPDCVLIEGPADASDMIPWLGHEQSAPPLALVSYRPDNPKRASSFPFAVFSPEYQAIRYALDAQCSVRFIDLPQSYLLGVDAKVSMPGAEDLQVMSQAAGHGNYEQWWHQLVEQRQDDSAVFEAVTEMMSAIRESELASLPLASGPDEPNILAEQREAHMRQEIRRAKAEGFQRLAVICGAFHTPALNLDKFTRQYDEAMLASVSSVAVDMAWVPWTYSRLSTYTGYGAGIPSPGWYQHLWTMHQEARTPSEATTIWLGKIARLLRQKGFDTSPAHIIETSRLAEAIAALRGQTAVGLADLNEAVQAVMSAGHPEPLQLIAKKLIIGERMGSVPPDSPMVPLQRDLHLQQEQLALRPSPEATRLNLDVREERDLGRSHLFHRLNLLSIPWATIQHVRAQGGTYHEFWHLQWQPEFVMRVIEANVWGNTIEEASSAFALDQAAEATELVKLTELLDQLILAELPDTIDALMAILKQRAALSSDVAHMMAALPPLARILRYGNVRKTNREPIRGVVDELIVRICLHLPRVCISINDDAALNMVDHMHDVQRVLTTLRHKEQQDNWQQTLKAVMTQAGSHGLIAGRACRLLVDSRAITMSEAKEQLEMQLSYTWSDKKPQHIKDSAYWIEGFFKGSGLVIVHDNMLWQLIDDWVSQVEEEHFLSILPLLRRTFKGFSETAKQEIHQRVNALPQERPKHSAGFNTDRAQAVIPLLKELLGDSP